MKGTKPKIIIILVMLLMIAMPVFMTINNTGTVGTSSSSENADKVYNINSADFNILINDDGSATITETWNVTYQKGEFTRFYKNILMSLPESEHFYGIKNFTASIDGIPCPNTDDTTGRPDGYFALTSSGDIATYELFKRSENQTRQFQVNYTLPEIIKLVNNEYYFFSYRALPKGYQKKIDNLNITVGLANHTPETRIELKYLTDGDAFTSGNKITTTAYNVNGLQKIQLKITGKTFVIPEYNKISKVSSNNNDNNDSDFNDILAPFFFMLLMMFFAIANKIYKDIKYRNLVKNDPRIIEKYILKWKHKVSPYKMLCLISKNSHLSFFLGLAMAYQRKYIDFSYNGEEITWRVDILQNTEDDLKPVIDILNEIKTYCDIHNFSYKSYNGFITMSIQNIQIFFEQSTSYKIVRDLLIELDKKKVFTKSKEKNQFNKDILDIHQILKYIPEKTNIKFENILFNPINITPAFDFINQELKESNSMQIVYGYAIIDEMLAFLHTIHVKYCKSNKLDPITGLALATASTYSSGSSCGSSCSSCGGGCGGCGGSD